MTAPDHGTSYATRHWQDRAACRDQPGGWDLDVLDDAGVRYAIAVCTRHCPVFYECRVTTERQDPRPRGVVQAGRKWGARAQEETTV